MHHKPTTDSDIRQRSRNVNSTDVEADPTDETNGLLGFVHALYLACYSDLDEVMSIDDYRSSTAPACKRSLRESQNRMQLWKDSVNLADIDQALSDSEELYRCVVDLLLGLRKVVISGEFSLHVSNHLPQRYIKYYATEQQCKQFYHRDLDPLITLMSP